MENKVMDTWKKVVSTNKVERPDYRFNGEYQFVREITPSGAEACIHLTFEEIEKQLNEKFYAGTLIDDGVDLWLVPKE